MINPGAKYYRDGYRLCRQIEQIGKAPAISVFEDRRAGMTFPTVNNPGYWCIFGVKAVVTHRSKRPLELIEEYETNDQQELFRSIIKNMRLMGCESVYADCSKAFESAEMDFEQAMARLNIDTIGLYDASGFDGFDTSYSNFDAAKAHLDDYGHQGIMVIPGMYKEVGNPDKGRWPGESMIVRDFQKAQKSDIKSSRPWESFPAINALNHVIMSYVISPWQKPEPDNVWTKNRDGYGG